MNINEIMKVEKNSLTEDQLKFVLIHNNILTAGSTITNGVITLAKNLKIMRDEKLYLQADCLSFEAYAETICGLKRSQAYSYIQVLEKLGEDFVQSTGQIGITKLTMLSSLPEDDRKTIIETVNVEDSSVAKLKSEIEKLTQKNNSDLEKYNVKEKDYKKSIVDLEQKISKLKEELHKQSSLDNQNKEIEKLQNQIKMLESEKKSQENISKMHQSILTHLQNKCENLQKQIEINSSAELVEFKLKFNELQQNILFLKQLIFKLPEEKQQNCKNALKKVAELLC